MKITRFEAGDAVPDYVLDAEPVSACPGPRPRIEFVGVSDLIETPERFVIMSLRGGQVGTVRAIAETGGGTVQLFAPTKPVHVVMGWQTVDGREGGEGVFKPLALAPIG